jgi:hypothetical protein
MKFEHGELEFHGVSQLAKCQTRVRKVAAAA